MPGHAVATDQVGAILAPTCTALHPCHGLSQLISFFMHHHCCMLMDSPHYQGRSQHHSTQQALQIWLRPGQQPSKPRRGPDTALHAGHLRFWLSAGRGGFGLTTKECLWSSFYVMAYTVPDPPPPQVPHLEGIKACSSPVPVKDPFSATVKSTNYLINALNLQHAERMGFDQVRSTGVYNCCSARLGGVSWLQSADDGLIRC